MTKNNHADLEGELLKVSAYSFADEMGVIGELLPITEAFQGHIDEIEKLASSYIEEIRKEKKIGGVEEFISQFGLNEKESIGLMCLAESLLRTPDNKSIDDLISDKLSGANWQKFVKEDQNLIEYVKIWGLKISSKFVEFEDSHNLFEKALYNISEPAIRNALKVVMTYLAKEFVCGQNIKLALKNSNNLIKKGYSFSFDMLGEAARTEDQAQKFLNSYFDALESLQHHNHAQNPNLSIKLSALHPRYQLLKQKRVMNELYQRVKSLVLKAKEYNISISIDAEESYRLDSELELFAKLILDEDLKDFSGLGFVLQAYQKRAIPIIEFLKSLAKITNKKIPIRLVKGAYWDNEIKWSQMEGISPDYPVFTRKSHTDLSYMACIVKLLENTKYFFPQFATHNILTASAIIKLAKEFNIDKESFEFQRLFGMGGAFYDQIIGEYNCRIYSPVGSFKELLPYLIRRLMENGANSNFVNQLLDSKSEIQNILRDPIARAKSNLEKNERLIKRPVEIFSNRKNSIGYNLGNKFTLKYLEESQQKFLNKQYQAFPIINGDIIKSGDIEEIRSPFDYNKIVGEVSFADEKTIKNSIIKARESFLNWSQTDINNRAKILEKLAILLKENEIELMVLLAREAGKTLSDTISEIREAIDFCNFYAFQARQLGNGIKLESYTGENNIVSFKPKGVFVCTSPWNFPLAIYVGQIAAALVCGNSVIVKPAETTSLIANLAIELFFQAGFPKDVIQFIPAYGKIFGDVVMSSKEIDGVAFTGSTNTANFINLTLAKRQNAPIAKLIAETGGQNCMIVDSTALLEQVVDDVVTSAFLSAGQRCSALRVLFVQEEIADELIDLIKGSMKELEVGDPSKFSTDVGSVISKQAKEGLEKHIIQMTKEANLIFASQLGENTRNGYFIAPHIFEIKELSQLTKENFGPILHLIRFNIKDLDKVISQINSTNYALTFGIHSRIEKRINYIVSKINAGNIYINRNITGAVVGVQPFGGMKLSGTGPKAGGHDYLKAFMNEVVTSNNITAIGGNIELLGN